MSGTLQDQLRKAGLASDATARKAKAEKRKRKRRERGAGAPAASEAQAAAERARQEKAERDRALNLERQRSLEQRAAAGRLHQLVEHARQPTKGGEIAYNFTDGGKIKTLYVTGQQQKSLAAGALAVARLGEGYALVPAAAADKLAELDAGAVVSRADAGKAHDEDDPYAGYEVPDDLMW